ncbi:MAG: hypothetical protein R3C97_02985 [Geminicoccaceae bacterium]
MSTAVPLCWLPPVAYHVLMLKGPHLLYAAPVSASLPSGRSWSLGIGSLLILSAIVLLAISTFRRGTGATVPTNLLFGGVLLALVFLGEFLFLSAFGTSHFFMLVLCLMLELATQSYGPDRRWQAES